VEQAIFRLHITQRPGFDLPPMDATLRHGDRNGYRPLRYVETKDGLFHLSSEIGALEIPAFEITFDSAGAGEDRRTRPG